MSDSTRASPPSIAPVTLETLGAVSLRDAAGASLPTILRQPKRLALLSYLALEGIGTYIRRDRLLALFWPDLDEAHARNGLNKSVHHLRQALGDGVLVGRGDDDLGLAADRFRCDAADFRQACAAQDSGRALELYRGDLLPGFHLGDGSAFEEWLEGERTQLRRQAARAARSLAEALDQAGQGAAAADTGRRAVALSGHDEPTVRWLMALLDQQGDRAGALRVYEELASQLRTDFGVQPDAETDAMRDGILEREGSRRGPGTAEATPDVPPVASAGPSVPAPGTAAGRRRLSRGSFLAGVAITVIGLVALGSVMRRGAPPPSPSRTFAVLPFTTTGTDTALIRLGHDLMVLISARVNGMADLEVIDPVAVMAHISADKRDGTAQRPRVPPGGLGATRVLQASLVRVGDRVQIDGQLIEAAGQRPLARVEVTAPSGDLVALADSVVFQIIGRLRPAGAPAAPGGPALSTRSVPALQAFLDGERLLAADRVSEATARYSAAIAADSSFWMAYWRYLYFEDDFGRVRYTALAQRLREHRDQLPEPEQTLVEARFVDSLAARNRLLAGAVAQHQWSWDAWYNYADHLYHFAPFQGGTLAAAHRALERTVALHPGFADAWDHLFVASLQEGDTVTARRALEELGRLQYDSASIASIGFDVLRLYRWYYLTVRAGGRPQSPLSDTIASAWLEYHGPIPVAAFDVGPLRFGLAEAQLDLGRRVLRLSPSRVIADGQLRGMALAWAARGAWDSALATTDRYVAETPLAEAALFRYELAVIGAWLGGVQPGEADRRRATVAQAASDLAVDARGELAWLDGVLAASQGDTAGIERARQRVRGMPEPMGGWLDRSLLGLALELQGARAASVATLAKVEGERIDVQPYERSNFWQPYLTAVNRMGLSRGLAALGDSVGALRQLRWVDGHLQVSTLERARSAMTGMVDLERARLESATGQAALAGGHYRQFLRRYDLPVPAHRHLVVEARAALDQIALIGCPDADSACGAAN
ncbi:MAG TPA: BTAD domain-containing putative transcriptional regulator [Gemmatimonadales bacterium]|nr:BTAD domain-containing putative transcriptional regulator [Gemmatimonadales bacterium]